MDTIQTFIILNKVWQWVNKPNEEDNQDHGIQAILNFINNTYGDLLCYVYLEHLREKHKRIKRRMIVFKSGDIFQRRFTALDYLEHRRNVLLATGMKFHQQVWLQSRISEEKFIIAGHNILHTLYGLSKEAEILFLADLEKVSAPFGTTNHTHISEDGTVFFSSVVHLVPGIEDYFFRPIVFSSQKQATYELFKAKDYSFNYNKFKNEVDKYEKKLKIKQQL